MACEWNMAEGKITIIFQADLIAVKRFFEVHRSFGLFNISNHYLGPAESKILASNCNCKLQSSVANTLCIQHALKKYPKLVTTPLHKVRKKAVAAAPMRELKWHFKRSLKFNAYSQGDRHPHNLVHFSMVKHAKKFDVYLVFFMDLTNGSQVYKINSLRTNFPRRRSVHNP